jgi:predicted extracellular nuclease
VPDAAGFAAYQEEIAKRQITYDDGLSAQNSLICNLEGFGDIGDCKPGAFNTGTDIRMGDTVDDLTGVLSYSFSAWRIRSIGRPEFPVVFNKENDRPSGPPDVGGQYKIASVNVLNFFTTIDSSGSTTTGIGAGPRGADSQEEFDRQEEKLVRALVEMDADIFGLVEIENDFLPGSSGNAIEQLVAKMNSAVGDSGLYNWVNPGTQFVDSGDAISNGLIYKTTSIQRLVGDVAILRDEDLPGLGMDVPEEGIFDGPRTNRAAVAAGFKLANGPCVLVSVNHFKSKGSVNGGPGNADAGDGAANNNAIRTLASEAVQKWLDTEPLGKRCPFKAIVGDLNSYAREDPITYLEDFGYTDVERAFNGDDAYSFVFDGQIGTLDYVMANRQLFNKVTGAATWKINADEPDAIDYNLDFGRDSLIFDGRVPFRFSDHDALLVGIEF